LAQGLPFKAARFSEVLSCLPDSAGNFLLLNLQSKKALPAPSIHYLSLSDGRSVMVADFSGLIYRRDPQLLHCANPDIESIRFGQFQSNPPVFRLSISSYRVQLLKQIDFRCQAKSLLIKFPERQKQIVEFERKPAPTVVSSRQNSALPANTNGLGGEAGLTDQDKKNKTRSLPPVQASSNNSELSKARSMSVEKPPFRSGGLFLSLGNDSVRNETPALAPEISLPSPAPELRSSSPAPNRVLTGTHEAPLAEIRLPLPAPELRSSLRSLEKKTPSLATDTKTSSLAPDAKNLPAVSSSKLPPLAPDAKMPPTAAEIKSPKQFSSLPEPEPALRKSEPVDDAAMAVLKKYLRSASERKKSTQDPQSVSKNLEKTEQSKFSTDLRKTETAFAERLAQIQNGKSAGRSAIDSKPAEMRQSKLESVSKARAQENSSGSDKQADITGSTNSAPRDMASVPASQVELAGKNPIQVKLKFFSSSKYKSFRLDDPPRLVLDLDDAQSAPDSALEPESNPFLKSVRIGNPSEKHTRVVFDLAQSKVHIKEEIDEKQKQLILTMGPALYETSNSLKGRLVVIDAGHGGSDPGAHRGDIQEKELTLSIAMKLKQYLENKGLKVTMTRFDDSFVSLEDRVKITNEQNPDAFVSIHINSLDTDRDITGIETYYQNGRSRQLAEKIHEQLVSKLQVPDRSVRKARFYVVNHTDNPAILAEVGFISNKDERDKLISSDYQAKIAESLGLGLMNFLSGSSQPDSPLVAVPGTQARVNESLLTINKQNPPLEGKLR
jgi:N-acetylmuramoyl-L-alanine amidase